MVLYENKKITDMNAICPKNCYRCDTTSCPEHPNNEMRD